MDRTNPDLTFICITKAEVFAYPYLRSLKSVKDALGANLLIGIDNSEIPEYIEEYADQIVFLRSAGYIESVLDEVIKEVQTEYVFRIDDDERLSASLFDWLESGEYRSENIFSFIRCNMWTPHSFITESPLFPDCQTRLTKKDLSLGVHRIHAGNPNGAGKIIPYALIHDKFNVKSYKERRAIADRYEAIQKGSGYSEKFLPFQLPEDYYKEGFTVYPLNATGDPKDEGYISDWRNISRIIDKYERIKVK